MFAKNFSYEYVQGYTAALQDVIDIIGNDWFQDDLRRHKRKQNYKTYLALLKCMLNARAILRENPDAFVRCNDQADGGFEVYIYKQGVYNPQEVSN